MTSDNSVATPDLEDLLRSVEAEELDEFPRHLTAVFQVFVPRHRPRKRDLHRVARRILLRLAPHHETRCRSRHSPLTTMIIAEAVDPDTRRSRSGFRRCEPDVGAG